jgi:hypothetical protein
MCQLRFFCGCQQPLMEAGLDSIGAVELRNAVTAKFGVELPATVTFDYPSASALAGFIASKTAVPAAYSGGAGGAWAQPTMVSVPVPSTGAFVQQIVDDLLTVVAGNLLTSAACVLLLMHTQSWPCSDRESYSGSHFSGHS